MPKKFRLSNRKTITKTASHGCKQRADGVQKSSIQKNAGSFEPTQTMSVFSGNRKVAPSFEGNQHLNQDGNQEYEPECEPPNQAADAGTMEYEVMATKSAVTRGS